MLAWMEAVVNLHLAEQDDRNVGAVAFADPGAGSESGVMFFRPGDEVVMRPGCLQAGRYGRVAVGLGLRPFFDDGGGSGVLGRRYMPIGITGIPIRAQVACTYSRQ